MDKSSESTTIETMEMMDESKAILPPEVIIEILSWLPVKSLSQVQLVCKEWHAFIHDHHFTEKHISRGKVIWHWYNVVRAGNYFSNHPERETFSYIHGCDGLLLLKANLSNTHSLWNPATRRVLDLPDPHIDSYGIAICFVPATRNYRIVSIYKDKESGGEGCEVLTPGQSEAWRRLKFPDTMNGNEHRKTKSISVVSAGGAVHFVIAFKVGDEYDEEIVSLDMGTECFAVNHLPKGQFKDLRKVSDLDWNGRLAFADISGQHLKVMELIDYKRQKWSKRKKVIPLSFMKKEDAFGEGNVVPLFAKQGEIWFWLKGKRIFTYTIETGEVTDIKQAEAFALSNKIYPYKPSLIAFEGMVPDTKLERLRPTFEFN